MAILTKILRILRIRCQRKKNAIPHSLNDFELKNIIYFQFLGKCRLISEQEQASCHFQR